MNTEFRPCTESRQNLTPQSPDLIRPTSTSPQAPAVEMTCTFKSKASTDKPETRSSNGMLSPPLHEASKRSATASSLAPSFGHFCFAGCRALRFQGYPTCRFFAKKKWFPGCRFDAVSCRLGESHYRDRHNGSRALVHIFLL